MMDLAMNFDTDECLVNIMRSCEHGKIRQSRRKSRHQNRRKRQAYGKNCTAISRKADSSRNGQLKRNLWIEKDKKGGNDYEENNF